jgi:hypothetical protein
MGILEIEFILKRTTAFSPSKSRELHLDMVCLSPPADSGPGVVITKWLVSALIGDRRTCIFAKATLIDGKKWGTING